MTGIAISWPGFDDDGDDDDDDDNLDHAGSSASGPEQQSKLKLSNMEKIFFNVITKYVTITMFLQFFLALCTKLFAFNMFSFPLLELRLSHKFLQTISTDKYKLDWLDQYFVWICF